MSKKKIQRHYRHRIHPARASYDVLDWASERSQQRRFEVLVEHVDLAGKRLLDVGCGLGDLLTFLRERKIPCDYTGVDILLEMVQAAHRRVPDGRFVQGDIFAGEPLGDERFDTVFCSGALNLNLGNNLDFLPHALAKMFALAREAMVVNLLRARPYDTDPTYFYHNPAHAEQLARTLTPDVQIVQDYLPNDFTVICRHRERDET